MALRKQYTYKYFTALIFLLFTYQSVGAPHPGVGTSKLADPENGFFFSRWGFTLNSRGSNLALQTSWNENGSPQAPLEYRPKDGPGLLTVQIDQLKANYSLDSYAKRWVRDYSIYGFDVKGTKFFQQGHAKGLVIDLVHQQKKQQLRQVVFLKNKTSVIISCQDSITNFLKFLPGCNQIIKSFNWDEESTRQKAF